MSAREPVRAKPPTLAHLIAAGDQVIAVCKGCRRRAMVPLEDLQKKRGPDFDVSLNREALAAACRCVACGHRGAEIEFHRPYRPAGAV